MKYVVTINGKNYEVEVEKGKASIVGTQESVKATAQPATAPAPVSQPQTAPAAPVQPAVQTNVSGEAVKAPMPGTILAVKVSKGQQVKKGETLFILEAMKMENEIAAPIDGVIADINVAKGASVNTGDVLVVLQ